MALAVPSTLEVPGATLHYEVQGDGPVLLFIPGAPEDGTKFVDIGAGFVDRYTVVTYDPRGLSRSAVDGPAVDTPVPLLADDAQLLLTEVGGGPATVVAESGGAVVGLELVTRFPTQVRRLIAHEPPCLRLLDDPEPHLRAIREVYETYRADGVGPAMERFLTAAGFAGDEAAGTGEKESWEVPEPMRTNLDFFLGHVLRETVDRYTPDIARLRGRPVTVTLGEGSVGQLPYRAALALAARLGTEPVTFPGDHFGMDSDPEAFSARLREVLDGRSV